MLVILYALLFLLSQLPELDHGGLGGRDHFILDHVVIQDVVEERLQEIQRLLWGCKKVVISNCATGRHLLTWIDQVEEQEFLLVQGPIHVVDVLEELDLGQSLTFGVRISNRPGNIDIDRVQDVDQRGG